MISLYKKKQRFTAAFPLLATFNLLLAASTLLASCTKINLYEKVLPIPSHNWQSNFKPRFTFNIKDTTAPYQLFLIFRHSEKYNYNNLWINLYTQGPGSDSVAKVQYELPLATNERGWLATGVDDVYDHLIALTPVNEKFYFKKSGTYTFTIEQIMREDPLEHVMNIGLRLEKKQP